MIRALIVCDTRGTRYYLTRPPLEWVTEREHAGEFDAEEAHAAAATYGGTVVLLDQRRTVAGTLGRESERGPRQ